MANADFSQNNKQTAPGGFDAGSCKHFIFYKDLNDPFQVFF